MKMLLPGGTGFIGLKKIKKLSNQENKEKIFCLLSLCGRLLSIACVFFIFFKLYYLWDKIAVINLNAKDFLYCGMVTCSLGMVNYFICAMWGNIVECLSGKSLNFKDLAYLYAKSNMAKYLPGNVMHYVSRSVLAQKYQIPLKTTVLASLLDALLCVASAFVFVLLTLHGEFLVFISFTRRWFEITGIILGALLIFTLYFLRRVREKGDQKIDKRLCLILVRAILRNGALYLFYFLWGASFFCYVLMVVEGSGFSAFFSSSYLLWKIGGLFTLSWLAGYLAPGAPGGIGIREAMLLSALSSYFPQETILASAFLCRILSTLSEIFTYALSVLLLRIKIPYF